MHLHNTCDSYAIPTYKSIAKPLRPRVSTFKYYESMHTYLHYIIMYKSIRNQVSSITFRRFIGLSEFQYNYGTTGDTDIIYYCGCVAIGSYKEYCILRIHIKYYIQ